MTIFQYAIAREASKSASGLLGGVMSDEEHEALQRGWRRLWWPAIKQYALEEHSAIPQIFVAANECVKRCK